MGGRFFYPPIIPMANTQLVDSQKSQTESISGVLLSRHWTDLKRPVNKADPSAPPTGNIQLKFWLSTDRGPLCVIYENQHAVFFIPESWKEKVAARLGEILGKVNGVWWAKPLELKSFGGEKVLGIYFSEQRFLYLARDAMEADGLKPLEGDVQPSDRFLMERFITSGIKVEGRFVSRRGYIECINPKISTENISTALKVLSLDIETSMTGDKLYSIAASVGMGPEESTELADAQVFMVGDLENSVDHNVQFFKNEKQLLRAFVHWFASTDPDILIGWNVINFDLRFLQRKADELRVPLTLGRNRETLQWRISRTNEQHYTLVVPGRAVLDGIDTMKSATYVYESFSLENVANIVLGKGKLIEDVDNRGVHISELFQQDKIALAKYNLEDCVLVWEIFVKEKLLQFALSRAHMTGLALDRFGGSVAAFDFRYLPRLHRLGLVAPALKDDPEGVGSPGGYVLDSTPGIYNNVLVLDFKSLYPSIIRTFLIDPAALATTESQFVRTGEETESVNLDSAVPGFNGAQFNRETAILPALIDELWQARDQAKREKNATMSQAIKILMNSFYGVLGTPGCRFFDPRLPSSITLRGHNILTTTKVLIEENGHEVIYGDTDSLFVRVNSDKNNDSLEQRNNLFEIGETLAKELNNWWASYLRDHYKVESALELEFETCFGLFVMPTIRGAETGSKKRYAGRKFDRADPNKDALVFKGLEAVRTDWTQLAREFQRELYRRIFYSEPYEDYIRQIVQGIYRGEHDKKLIYRKRLRRGIEEYQKNIPPHVQAARKAEDARKNQGRRPQLGKGSWVEYVLTVQGPMPVSLVFTHSENNALALDYELYVERQIKPIVDSITQFLGSDFDHIAGQQMGLF